MRPRFTFTPGVHVSAILLWMLILPGISQAALMTGLKDPGYTVIIPREGGQEFLRSALLLSDVLTRMTGSLVGVKSSLQDDGTIAICLITPSAGIPGVEMPGPDTLGPDGCVISYNSRRYIIAGHTPRGVQNGCYTFLEEVAGCRLYAPGSTSIPKDPKIPLRTMILVYKPFFTFRDLHAPASLDSSYRDWHKLHREGENYEKWGMWVHTFNRLMPPSQYFESHPEYFSLVGGIRIPDGQLCLSNPDVRAVLENNLRDAWKLQPDAGTWSVSQNDTYKNCECDACRKLDSLYGGPSGTMIWFVNQVAEAFPGKTISTLAYQYTRQAPRNIKPGENVNVVLCSIECDRSRPISEGDPGFEKDLAAWGKLTGNLMIWDYIVQFRNFIDPFPNLRVLQPNLQMFRKYQARMMFQQGSGQSWCDMSELRQYLVAHLLWDPDADMNQLTDDFLRGYFGAAAPFIRQYIDLMHDSLRASGGKLGIYGFPFDGYRSYLTPTLVRKYETLFDRAEKAVRGEPEYSGRVLKARLPLLYARLDISLHEPDPSFSWFTVTNGKKAVNPAMTASLDTFVVRCSRYDITRLDENGTTPEGYRTSVREWLSKAKQPNAASGKPVTLGEPASTKYPVGGGTALTDGLFGLNDYHYNWLGFEGNDLEAVIDLGRIQPVNFVAVNFLQFTQAWIFLPEEVQISVSEDGSDYTTPVRIPDPVSFSQTGSFIQDFSAGLEGAEARFVKVKAVSLKTCPAWHSGHGLPCWIFCDEIVVQ